MIFVIRGAMRRLVEFQDQVHVDADTVEGGLHALCLDYPDLQRVLLDASGRLRGVHRIAVNRTMLNPSEPDRPVGDGDVVELVTALAGG